MSTRSAEPPSASPVDPAQLDLGYLSLFVGYAMSDAVLRALVAEGFRGLRVSHGFVFQHLIGAERTVNELAERMDVTQQAASKVVAELSTLGYVERAADAADARVRRVRLTDRGHEAVEAARRARAALDRKLVARCGADALAHARSVLAQVLDELGGAEAVRGRRVVAPR